MSSSFQPPEANAPKRRAIVCFVEDESRLLQQALALRQSWLYTQSPDTDLVIMGPSAALRKIPDDVVKIVQRVVADDPEWLYYRYANSMACLNGVNAWQLDSYSHLMMTDVDTFITPAWNRFYPDRFVCGNGAYSNDEEVCRKIQEISAELGYQHRGLVNTGSTWYGPTPLVRRMAAATEMVLRYILSRCFREEQGAWPGWYHGVSLLYAAEIVINHFAPDAEKSSTLDHASDSQNSIQEHAHIHCWHTDIRFSKHHFMDGLYLEEEETSNLNLDIIAHYAMEMSFRSLHDLAAANAALAASASGGKAPETLDSQLKTYHPHWQGRLIISPDGKTIRHEEYESTGKFDWDGKCLTVYWDNYPSEKFIKVADLFVAEALFIEATKSGAYKPVTDDEQPM
jgi:hypothetical protein